MRSACAALGRISWEADRKQRGSRHDARLGRAGHTRPSPDSRGLQGCGGRPGGAPCSTAPQIHQPSRTLVVPLLAAVLGAAVATATFALVNIEDEPVNVSLPSQAAQSAPPSDAVAGQRNDAGPAEGTAQQIIRPTEIQGSSAATSAASRYDGGPNEGASSSAMSSPPAAAEPAGPEAYGGMRP